MAAVPYPLHEAVRDARGARAVSESLEMRHVTNLLEAGADVNKRDDVSRTPLDYCMHAASSGESIFFACKVITSPSITSPSPSQPLPNPPHNKPLPNPLPTLSPACLQMIC